MTYNSKYLGVALITGAAKRVGAALARTLHQAGFNVIIHYRHSQALANQLCAELNSKRADSSITLQADLTQLETLENLITHAHNAWGQLDVLINNASDYFATPAGNVSVQDWNILMSSNLAGPFFLSQAAFPYLSSQQGCIINFTDINAFSPLANYSVYCVAKAGLTMMTKSLALDFGPTVRVNAIAPGSVLWPEHQALTEAEKQIQLSKAALKRTVSLKDICSTALFLIENQSITGHTLRVDAGRGL